MIFPEIRVFDSLVYSPQFTIAFKDLRSFDLQSLTSDQMETLGSLRGIEIVFPSDEFDFQTIGKVLIDLQSCFSAYKSCLFIREVQQPISRLRSYKGILGKRRESIVGLEKEYFVEGNESFFACMLDLKSVDAYWAFDKFLNHSMNFIRMTKTPDIDEIELDLVMQRYYDAPSDLNYIKLVIHECSANNIIVRAGGDGGRTFTSIQYFVRDSEFPMVYNSVKDHLCK